MEAVFPPLNHSCSSQGPARLKSGDQNSVHNSHMRDREPDTSDDVFLGCTFAGSWIRSRHRTWSSSFWYRMWVCQAMVQCTTPQVQPWKQLPTLSLSKIIIHFSVLVGKSSDWLEWKLFSVKWKPTSEKKKNKICNKDKFFMMVSKSKNDTAHCMFML